MSYKVKLESFEGPLDLLFHLIEKNEIDIYNIPISDITNQYLDYINEMHKFDMDVASEFLVMAATLLEIKSRMLLPNPVEEQLEFDVQGLDPRKDLVLKLIEYKKYKNVANYLKEREEIFGKTHFKQQDNIEEFIGKIDYKDKDNAMEKELLVNAMNRIFKKLSKIDKSRKEFFKELKRDIFTVEKKIEILIEKVKIEKEIKFLNLFNGVNSKMEVIVTFLALLELLKLKKISIKQEGQFSDIYIYDFHKD